VLVPLVLLLRSLLLSELSLLLLSLSSLLVLLLDVLVSSLIVSGDGNAPACCVETFPGAASTGSP
jgi:hypothetical protein